MYLGKLYLLLYTFYLQVRKKEEIEERSYPVRWAAAP